MCVGGGGGWRGECMDIVVVAVGSEGGDDNGREGYAAQIMMCRYYRHACLLSFDIAWIAISIMMYCRWMCCCCCLLLLVPRLYL